MDHFSLDFFPPRVHLLFIKLQWKQLGAFYKKFNKESLGGKTLVNKNGQNPSDMAS